MFRARRGRGGNGRGAFDPYAIMMLIRLGQQIVHHVNGAGQGGGAGVGVGGDGDATPVATLALVALMLASHFAPDLADLGLLPGRLAAVVAPPLQEVCMQPRLIVEGPRAASSSSSWLRRGVAKGGGGGGGLLLLGGQGGGWRRLVAPAFVHADMSHLAYNVSSLLWKGAVLEPSLGPGRTLALFFELLLLSHGLFVASAWALARQPGADALLRAAPWLRPLLRSVVRDVGWPLYAHSCAVGCSAVLFALKIVLQQGRRQGRQGGNDHGATMLWGVRVPARHAAWFELALASLVDPGLAPFAAHLSGIGAGLVHVRVLAPAWRAFWAGGGGAGIGGGGVFGARGGGGIGGAFGVRATRRPRADEGGERAAAATAAATEAAAAAAEARRRAAEARGRPAARQQQQGQQQQGPLSAEELRERRIRRLGG